MAKAANSRKTAARPKPGEPGAGRPFKPGQSGNPSGRPPGLAKTARELVGDDGKALIQFWASVMIDKTASLPARLEASKLLAERGWGKAPSYEPMSADDPLEHGDMEREIDRLMDELAPRREAKPVGEAPGRGVAQEG